MRKVQWVAVLHVAKDAGRGNHKDLIDTLRHEASEHLDLYRFGSGEYKILPTTIEEVREAFSGKDRASFVGACSIGSEYVVATGEEVQVFGHKNLPFLEVTFEGGRKVIREGSHPFYMGSDKGVFFLFKVEWK